MHTYDPRGGAKKAKKAKKTWILFMFGFFVC